FDGGYRPLAVTGDRARHVLAFARGDGIVVISAVKCAAAMQLDSDGIPVLSPDLGGDTVVSMPTSAGSWHDLLRERSFAAAGPQRVADLLIGFPLAVIRREAQG